MAHLMIYGASGYTGRLASEHAQTFGLPLVVAGRSEAAVARVAASLNAPYRIFGLDDPGSTASALENADVRVLLNCAGPFASTAAPLVAACVAAGVHYLDISAELGSYQLALERHDAARTAGAMLLPGCGGSVAMLGCLAAHALRNMQSPTHIDVALRVAGPMSRGSMASAARSAMAGARCWQRLGDELVPWGRGEDEDGSTGPAGRPFDFDDGAGPVPCFPITLPDLTTIWKSTGVANIRTFACVAGSETMPLPKDGETIPEGPAPEEREATPYHAAVTVASADGTVKHAALHTVNGYTFTAMASVEAARRVLGGEFKAGFQTPAMLFGKSFVETVAGSRLADVDTSRH